MSDWTGGYVADIDYTYGYYAELNPQRIKLAFLNQSLVFPEMGTACELGFGQGLSTNIHAAASVAHWCGTDFNPSQAGFAQELSAASGAGARLYDESFADFAARTDLPEFDYIGLHGIWSWISDQNRAVIVDFIRRKLKVGGVLYISYNTQPGWAAIVPMRDLLTEHAQVMGADGAGIVRHIDAALEFAEQLIATNPGYIRANPQIADWLKQTKSQNRNYLAHEYFNRDWRPMSFTDMAKWLEAAKVSFACSANYFDQIDAINLNSDQQSLLKSIPDTMFRQTVRDFMTNQQFRKDYWVKGVRTLSDFERLKQSRAQRVLLVQPRSGIKLEVSGALGKATLQDAVYGPILDLLADHQARSLGEIEQSLAEKVKLPQIIQAVMVCVGAGYLVNVQTVEVTQKSKDTCNQLNSIILSRAQGGPEINYLASPMTGGGVALGRFEQLFLFARAQGLEAKEWPEFVWSIFQSQGHRLIKNGQPLQTPKENLTELEEQAQEFLTKRMPILKALQVF